MRRDEKGMGRVSRGGLKVYAEDVLKLLLGDRHGQDKTAGAIEHSVIIYMNVGIYVKVLRAGQWKWGDIMLSP